MPRRAVTRLVLLIGVLSAAPGVPVAAPGASPPNPTPAAGVPSPREGPAADAPTAAAVSPLAERLTALAASPVFHPQDTGIAVVALPDGRTAFERNAARPLRPASRSEEHTSELQSLRHLVCRLLLEKRKTRRTTLQDNHVTYIQGSGRHGRAGVRNTIAPRPGIR